MSILFDCKAQLGLYFLRMPLIRLENVSRRVNGKWTLWDVNLDVEPGEILAVFGRSDSGKTALARVIAGLDEPTKGYILSGDDTEQEIIVDLDEDECPANNSEDIEEEYVEYWGPQLSVSLAFCSPAFAPELTVYENLDMFASLWRIPKKQRARDIAFLLELMKLSDQRSAAASILSAGALRRLEIARALAVNAQLTIFDSLLDTLEPVLLEKLWDYILSLRRNEGKSFIIMTSFGRIAELAPKMAVIHKGKIIYTGRPDDFRRAAGEDMVVLSDISDPVTKRRICEQFNIVIKEEDGFLSFRASSGERVITDLLAEFGGELGCVYLKRPTLEDALSVIENGGSYILADVGERKSS